MELQQISISSTQPIIDALMSHEGHLSFSSLKAFKDSPATFMEYKMSKRESTPAMLFGAMLHCLVLEPQEFDKRYLCLDDTEICNTIGGAKPRATNKYKEWYAATIAEAGEREIVETDAARAAKAIASNVRHNRASAKILDMGWEHEKPIEWEYYNFKFKGFIDGIGEKCILDLKTCADAQQDKFQRDLIKNSYYLQAAMYLYWKGENIPYYIIAVDQKMGVSVHKLDQRLIEHGMQEYSDLLERFNECILKDQFDRSYDFWSERHDGLFICEKPGWLY